MISQLELTEQNNTLPQFYPHMKREELIGYCDIHADTERALFSYPQIAQMIEYAGRPKDWARPEEWMKYKQGLMSLHEEMKGLVALARKLDTKE